MVEQNEIERNILLLLYLNKNKDTAQLIINL